MLETVKQKGVYLFEYMDSFKKFSEDKLHQKCEFFSSLKDECDKLHQKCEFFSSLKDECISGKDYSHAVNVWNTFEVNTICDYHYLCLKTDILLLAGVFEKFINMCLEYYGLDLSLF